MFVQLENKLINFDHVRKVEIRPVGNEQLKTIQLTFSTGDTETFHVSRSFQTSRFVTKVVPAPPDYFVVYYSRPEDRDATTGATWLDPIIAFALDPDGVRPILLDGVAGADKDYAIMRPDGKIDLVFDRTFDSVAEFRDYMDARRKPIR